MIEDYGEEEADELMNMMYVNYNTMAFLDTGLYDIGALMDRMRHLCEVIETEQVVEQHVAAAVHESLALTDQAFDADVVQHIFEYLRRGKHIACYHRDIAFGRIAEQKFIGVNLTLAVEDRLAC